VASDKNSIILNAQRLTAKGEIDKAIQAWRTLIAETPNDGNIYNTIGDLYLKKGAQAQAIEAFLKAGATFQTAGFALKTIAVYKKIIKLDPGRMDVVLKLAEVNAERGIVGNAVEDYLKVARHELKDGRVKAAIDVYRKIAALDPANPTIGLKLAELCQKEGLISEAREELMRVATQLETMGKTVELQQIRTKLSELDGVAASSVPDAKSLPPPRESPPETPSLSIDRSGSGSISGSINEETLVAEAAPPRIEASESPVAPAPVESPAPPAPELSRLKGPSEFDETTHERLNDALTEADVYVKYGMLDKALAHVKNLARQDSSNIDVQLKLKELLMAQGNTKAAAEVCLKIGSIYQLLGQEAEQRAMFDEAVALDPERVGERSQANPRAEVSLSAAERSARAETSATVAGQSPADAGAQDSDPEEVLALDLAEADFYFQQGFDDEAHRLFSAILQKVPDHPLATERLREISERAERVVDPVNPVDPEKTSQAINGLPEETSLGSAIAVGNMTKGAAHPRSEMTKEEEYIDLVDALREDMERSLPPAETEELSQELSAERELEGVFRKFQKGVQEQYGKEDYETHYNLGIAYREMGLLNEAIGEFRLVLKSPDRVINATSMLATCYREKGQLARAEEILGEALDNPTHTGAEGLAGLAYELGRIIEIQGRHDDALANYYRAKKLEPEHKEARERIADLEKRAAGSAPRATAAIAAPETTVGPPSGTARPIRRDKKKISYL
jgi:tetratricopeptide (TPR) repeat protein